MQSKVPCKPIPKALWPCRLPNLHYFTQAQLWESAVYQRVFLSEFNATTW